MAVTAAATTALWIILIIINIHKIIIVRVRIGIVLNDPNYTRLDVETVSVMSENQIEKTIMKSCSSSRKCILTYWSIASRSPYMHSAFMLKHLKQITRRDRQLLSSSAVLIHSRFYFTFMSIYVLASCGAFYAAKFVVSPACVGLTFKILLFLHSTPAHIHTHIHTICILIRARPMRPLMWNKKINDLLVPNWTLNGRHDSCCCRFCWLILYSKLRLIFEFNFPFLKLSINNSNRWIVCCVE